MRDSETVVRRKRTVIILWVIAFIAVTPLLLDYGNYISYSESPKSLSNSESSRAQQVFSSLSPSNSTLVVVFQPSSSETEAEIQNQTLAFQAALNSSGIPYLSGSSSAFSSWEKVLKSIYTNNTVTGIRETYSSIATLSEEVYAFPSAFLGNWTRYGPTQSGISQAASSASYDGSAYESLFLKDLNQTFTSEPSWSAVERVQNSTSWAAVEEFFPLQPFEIFPVVDTPGYNVTDYRTDLLSPVSTFLTSASGIPISERIVETALIAGTNASSYYLSEFGLLGAPSFIRQQYISPDNTTYLVTVNFNVTESYRGANDFYPAQSATPQVRELSQKYFGTSEVTGLGAVAADTAQLSASSAYAFGLIFVFLAVAVGLLFACALPPVLVLVVVSLTTALGYVSITLTGMVLGSVNYDVTNILTAVVLGVSTDYFVFTLARYREELRGGGSDAEALDTAVRRARFAIVVSGVTIALSLGAISLVSGLESWGPVLAITILLTVLLETTLVPAILGLLGPRVFTIGQFSLRRGRGGPTGAQDHPPSVERSSFYRIAKLSQRRKFLIVGVIVLLAVPTTVLWFTMPTTYNLNEGLPQSLPSERALTLVDQKFGSSIIYPTFVIVSFPQNATAPAGGLTQAATSTLESDAKLLLGTEGIKQVVGPTINGTKIEPSNLDSQFVFDHGSYAYFVVFTDYDPYSSSAISLVNQLRANDQFLVGGLTSSIIDLRAYYNSAFLQLELLIVAVIAIVLGYSFRSAKYPFISLTGVFISITWTTAILYAISKYLLGEELVFLIPIIVYVILMSLGNDFAVFILSRVREEQAAHGFEDGLARAMVGSGSVVTALGVILAVSLGSLGLVPFGLLEQIGIAFVISMLLDTFVIRTFYFPSMLLLLDRGEPAAPEALSHP